MLNTRLHSTIYKLLQKLDQVAAPSGAISANSCFLLETEQREFAGGGVGGCNMKEGGKYSKHHSRLTRAG